MSVPFLDLKMCYQELHQEIDEAIHRVLASGWYIHGEEVEAFEREYAGYCEARHCVGVASGLDALHLSLMAMGVEAGDEVIVPSNTFIATWLAVSRCDAIPVPVEPDPFTCNMDVLRIEGAITPRTKVIMPVHLYGQPADLDPILELARRRGLSVLQDAAQAHGARYKGKRIGSHGDVVAWSFYPGKNLGAFGDGGAITTNSAEIAEKVRMLGNYGSREKYKNLCRGFNSRLDPIQAAALRVKLRHLDRWNEARRQVAIKYLNELPESGILLPFVPEWAEPAWHLFVIRSPHRDQLQEKLREAGIATLIHYPIPPHLQEAYLDHGYRPGDFPLAEKIHREVLSLPLFPGMTLQQVAQVTRACREALATPVSAPYLTA